MAATIFGTDGLTFGTTAETGGILQNIEVTKKNEKVELRDEQGQFCAVAFYNPTEEISGEAVLTGSSGLGGIAPAAALTLSSYTPDDGSIFVEEVSQKYSITGFKTTSFKAFVYPLVSSS